MSDSAVRRQDRQRQGGLGLRLSDVRVRAVLYQVAAAATVVLVGWYLIDNTLANLSRQAIATGFGFLERQASFAISESPIPYSPIDTYARAVLVGLLNTLKVSILGIILATLLGTLIGIARLSSNWLVAKLASAYVEVIRNIPLLLQLFFWYSVITVSLPGPRQALQPLPGVFMTNRGLRIPVPMDHPVWAAMAVAFVLAVAGAVVLRRWAARRQERTGRQFPVGWTSLALIVGLPLLTYGLGGAPVALDVPELRGFNFDGGANLSPELTALLMGVVTYTASFIAEIVRSGILSVSQGQHDAAKAVGLTPGQTLRLVILPQALRLIIPPMTGQYLNLTKNSSLAIAIGYPDVVLVLNIAINQTGQAIEGVAMIMAVYLTISLSISLFMNWYNRHIALVER